eukprot:scaffold84212_cov63-Phaeocystis_antarctica.AAC.7
MPRAMPCGTIFESGTDWVVRQNVISILSSISSFCTECAGWCRNPDPAASESKGAKAGQR